MTKVAWGKKRDQIQKVIPGAKKGGGRFQPAPAAVLRRSSASTHAKPHGFARFLALVYRLIPKIGPFRALSFSVPTPEAERLFLESFTSTREHFRQSLDARERGASRSAQHRLRHGQPTTRGEYSLADETYDDELLGKLADRAFASVSENSRSNPRGLLPETSARGQRIQTPSGNGCRGSGISWQSSIR